jgi:hypothetical protein
MLNAKYTNHCVLYLPLSAHKVHSSLYKVTSVQTAVLFAEIAAAFAADSKASSTSHIADPKMKNAREGTVLF